jgi:lysozyme family protein
LVILLPTWLIGVCMTPEHPCYSTLKPLTIALGSVIIAASLVGLVLSQVQKEKSL